MGSVGWGVGQKEYVELFSPKIGRVADEDASNVLVLM